MKTTYIYAHVTTTRTSSYVHEQHVHVTCSSTCLFGYERLVSVLSAVERVAQAKVRQCRHEVALITCMAVPGTAEQMYDVLSSHVHVALLL